MGLDSRWSELSGLMMSILEKMVLRIWGFRKDSLVSTIETRGWVFQIWKADQFGSLLAEILIITRCAARMGEGAQHSMVGICFYDLCLSLCVTKDWRWKEINLFVPPVSVLLMISLCLYDICSIWCVVTCYVFCKKKKRKKETMDFEHGLSTRWFTVL